jgi:hypothetical protein
MKIKLAKPSRVGGGERDMRCFGTPGHFIYTVKSLGPDGSDCFYGYFCDHCEPRNVNIIATYGIYIVPVYCKN